MLPFIKLFGLVLFTVSASVQANTEKAIFLGPTAVTIPNVNPSLGDLRLDVLSPIRHSVRTKLAVHFPSDERPQGSQHWYLLDGLTVGQRYEVRVCWAATQPTDFWLDVHTITSVLDTPSLIADLALYSEQRQNYPATPLPFQTSPSPSAATSILFLQIHAAASFYSLNRTLMERPPDVLVDIILDPYLWNAFPQSLVPTGGYILILAIGGWFISGAVWDWLRAISKTEPKPHAD